MLSITGDGLSATPYRQWVWVCSYMSFNDTQLDNTLVNRDNFWVDPLSGQINSPKSQHAVNDIKIVTLIKEEVIFHTLCGPHKAYFNQSSLSIHLPQLRHHASDGVRAGPSGSLSGEG